MGFFKEAGSFLGEVVGTVTGEPIKFIGKKLNNDYIQEIGEGVKKATTNTGHIVGSVAEGTWNTASGMIHKDDNKRDEGLKELKTTAIQTAKGVGQSINNTYHNGKDLVQGVVNNDKEQIIKGAKGIGKTVAVTTLAVGVLDIVDGIDIGGEHLNHVQADTLTPDDISIHESHFNHDIPLSLENISDTTDTDIANEDVDSGHVMHIETRNEDLAGEHHPVTGVEFEPKTVILPNGNLINGVFPIFDSEYTATLPESMYLESNDIQFSYANGQLAEEIQHNPDLAHEFNATQQAQILSNETPYSYSWHHSEEPGKMQLVDEKIHAETGHTGGQEIWAGGTENR